MSVGIWDWTLNFSVSDSGCGIKRKKMNMFDLYPSVNMNNLHFKNDKDVMDSSELMGMGLSYWNKILNKMSSKLKLSTVLNVGSTFSFAIKVKTDGKACIKSKFSCDGNSSVI